VEWIGFHHPLSRDHGNIALIEMKNDGGVKRRSNRCRRKM